jgi:hypothetical protein
VNGARNIAPRFTLGNAARSNQRVRKPAPGRGEDDARQQSLARASVCLCPGGTWARGHPYRNRIGVRFVFRQSTLKIRRITQSFYPLPFKMSIINTRKQLLNHLGEWGVLGGFHPPKTPHSPIHQRHKENKKGKTDENQAFRTHRPQGF